jgi:hypothetical protein
MESERAKNDEVYRYKLDVRRMLSNSYTRKGFRKSKRTEELLGCSFEFFKKYIESKFKRGMSWKNFGKWHFDHIIPLATAKTIEEIDELCHFSNIQPLWANENFEKSDKIPLVQLHLQIHKQQ